VIDGASVVGVIPARGGSKVVPRKNVRDAGGRPLLAWTIDAARGSRYLDRTILSSDDAEIIAVARAHGCDAPFVRAGHLAGDDTSTLEVVLDALERCPGYPWVVVLQPTSPLRTARDIDAAIDRCVEARAPACVSVCLAHESPYWMYSLGDRGHLKPLLPDTGLTRRQDLPPVYHLNGAVYVARTDWLARERTFVSAETVGYEMPIDRSLDVDTERDFLLLDALLRA